jgi:hypothetical protein
MTTREYQNLVYPLLQKKMPKHEVVNEWTAFTGYKNHYSPRVDIAVGPFSTIGGQNKIEKYNSMMKSNSINQLIRNLYDKHVENIGIETKNEILIPKYDEIIYRNQNARCFLAIEIENENSKKHIMGSLINAASLGRIGVGVAYTQKTMRTFIRIMNYLGFLRRVGKNTYDTTNFLIVSKDQLINILK